MGALYVAGASLLTASTLALYQGGGSGWIFGLCIGAIAVGIGAIVEHEDRQHGRLR